MNKRNNQPVRATTQQYTHPGEGRGVAGGVGGEGVEQGEGGEGKQEQHKDKERRAILRLFPLPEKETEEPQPLPLLGDVRMDPDQGGGEGRRESGSRQC